MTSNSSPSRLVAPGICLASLFVCALLVWMPHPPPSVYVPDVAGPSDEAERAMARFRKNEELRIELVAAEPFLANPVAFDIDRKGNFYVAETFRVHQGVTDMREHPGWLVEDLANRTVQDRLATMRRNLGSDLKSYRGEHDRVKLLRDSDGDGELDQHQVFVDGFQDYLSGIGSGVLVDGDDVFYACIPDLLRFQDQDGDGRADTRQVLSTGYGVRFGFLGHDLHGLIKGPDGKIYFSIGDRGFHVETPDGTLSYPDEGAILRSNPDGSELEVIHRGLRNPQELAFDDWGNLFTGDNNSDGGDQARWVQVVEGGDSGWRVGYQYMETPIARGPWNSERMWRPPFPGQAAYIVPPIANIGAGPSGISYYPGTGLGERYKGHFFLSDFRGDARSKIHAFTLQARGATFELVDRHDFVQGPLVTDVEFGPAGGLYFSDWVAGWRLTGKGRIYRAFFPESEGEGLIEETRGLLASDFESLSPQRRIELLAHIDQRVRLQAQESLSESPGESWRPLLEAALRGEERVSRVHALWGLGRILRGGTGDNAALLPLLTDPDPEIRAQTARMAGDLGWREAAPILHDLLLDSSDRVRSLAALALSSVGDRSSLESIAASIDTRGISDPYLRHSMSMALFGSAKPADLAPFQKHPNPDVRMCALLALRRHQAPSIAAFLNDGETAIVVEAARAIYDTPIEGALTPLARLIGEDRILQILTRHPLDSEQLYDLENPDALQSDNGAIRFALPLMMRIIGANRRLGDAVAARGLARLAARTDVPALGRAEALRRLRDWSSSPQLDSVVGVWRPAPAWEPVDAAAALNASWPDLLRDTSPVVKREAIATLALHRVDVSTQLLDLLKDGTEDETTRVVALEALVDLNPELGPRGIEIARRAHSNAIKSAAIQQMARIDPTGIRAIVESILAEGSLLERQTVFGVLADLEIPEAAGLLRTWMGELLEERVPTALQLDIVSAARNVDDPGLQDLVARFDAESDDHALSRYRTALQGGDADRGRTVFFEKGSAQCLRCHSLGGRGGGMVGPDLSDVGARTSRRHILESIAFPNLQIAEGYGQVDIVTTDGRTFSGRVVEEDESSLVIESDTSFYEFEEPQDALAHSTVDTVAEEEQPSVERTRLAKSEIRSRRSGLSSMPENVVDALENFELRDLVEFLSRQGESP